MVKIKCKICKKSFEVRNYRKNTARYCSVSCKYLDKQLSKIVSEKNKKTKQLLKAQGKIKPAWNKGLKGIHLSPTSEFKKGIEPWNKNLKGIHLYKIGTIQKRKMNGGFRNWIKIKHPDTWMLYARYLWLKSGRKLIKGMVIHHKNGNQLDDRIENLDQISRNKHINIHRND
jgi:hypothetical protein